MTFQRTSSHSRKFSLFAAILILLIGIAVGGYLVLKSGRGSASQLADILNTATKSISGCQPDPSDTNKDSDNDGLKDWQEMQIYHSDPCKPDTDGDGYLDGEEVASGYDPTVKAPNDVLAGAKPVSPRPLPQNLTEALSQQLKDQISQGQIPQLDANGALLSASSTDFESFPGVQAVVDEMYKNDINLFAPDKIDDGQIKTTSDNSKVSIQRFAAMVVAAVPSSRTGGISETEIITKAIEENDFSGLDENLKKYNDGYKKLKELTVPSELLPLFKKQLEIISGTIKIYEGLKTISDDPLKANLALQAFQSVRQQSLDWAKELITFIQNHK